MVVYSNVEDFGRFGCPAVRVEFRPPSGFVRRNGVGSTLRFAKFQFVNAFKALAVVLKNVLSGDELLSVSRWLCSVWGVR